MDNKIIVLFERKQHVLPFVMEGYHYPLSTILFAFKSTVGMSIENYILYVLTSVSTYECECPLFVLFMGGIEDAVSRLA